MLIKNNSLVLFQGDSITDTGRNRDGSDDLGVGYASFIASMFPVRFPDLNIRFLNRGIGGNRVSDLQARWQADCIDLQPDIVSILIGVNDCQREGGPNIYTELEKFEVAYRDILERTQKNTSAKLIIIEPFILPMSDDIMTRRRDLDLKIGVVRKMAREYKALLIPMDGIFAQYSVHRPMQVWSTEGVHPTREGHMLIAEKWMESISE